MGLLVGSEGTLAVVTEVTVRLLTRAELIATVLAIFESTRAASETVSAIIAGGTVPAALEMMDGMSARAVEQGLHVGFPLDAGAVLLIELEGVREGFAEDPRSDLSVVLDLCRAHGARSVRTATAGRSATPSGKDARRRAGPWGAWPPTTTSTTESCPAP